MEDQHLLPDESECRTLSAFYAQLTRCLAVPAGYPRCIVCTDIQNFRLFNKIYGTAAGDMLLDGLRSLLRAQLRGERCALCYLGIDYFVALLPDESDVIKSIVDGFTSAVSRWSTPVCFPLLLGIYGITDSSVPPETLYDRAEIALSEARKKPEVGVFRYTDSMEQALEAEVQLLNNIRNGLQEGEFTFFIQPQCNIFSRKIVGGEALARWVKPDGTVVSPGRFIPVLEKNKLIHLLDCVVWEGVFCWLRSLMDAGLTPVPISINISRLDIMALDVPSFLFGLQDKYNIPEKYIKAEITESAFTENDDRITYTVNALVNRGIKVMMDDFGSGYSSLNMLKSIPTDVLKLDMRFLDISDTVAEKGINILESVVNLARLLRLPIVVEGVETREQEHYVLELGCRYTQGFLYYKPLPTSEFEKLLLNPQMFDRTGMHYKQVEPLHKREFIDSNFISDVMLNQVMGAVAFYEMDGLQITITRVNEQYLRLIGGHSGQGNGYGDQFWNNVRDDDRALLHLIFRNAVSEHTGDGATGLVHLLRMDGQCITVRMQVFFLREKAGRQQFYASLVDITEYCDPTADALPRRIGKSEEFSISDDMRKAYDAFPEGVVVQHVTPGTNGNPHDFQIVYFNQALGSLFYGTGEQIRQLSLDAFGTEGDGGKALEAMVAAAYRQECTVLELYSSISNRYLEFHFFPAAPEYAGAIIRDSTVRHVSSTALSSISLSYREVYYLQLKNNYYRMLYPSSVQLMERGNYSDAVERHFVSGRILSDNEKAVRAFLSLENIAQALETADKIEMHYKRSHNGQDEWCLTSVTISERDAKGAPVSAIMVIRSIDALIRRSESERSEYLSAALGKMSDAFFIYYGYGDERLIFTSPATAALFGCRNEAELREYVHNSFRGMVYPEDLKRVEAEIRNHINTTIRKMDYTYYRIVRKDGRIRWIDDIGHFDTAQGESGVYYVFLNDVTDTLPQAEKNRIVMRSQHFNRSETLPVAP